LAHILAINFYMVMFNKILAFPLVGGRVLRAILSTKQPFRRATQIDARSGNDFAILFGFTGLIYNPFLTTPHRTITCSSAMG
jgi:Zn-dependent protease